MDAGTKKDFFINALLIAHADGVFDAKEKHLLICYANAAGISDKEIGRWYEDMRGGDIAYRPITDQKQAKEMLALAVGVAASNGTLDAKEHEALIHLTKAVGLAFQDLQAAVTTHWHNDVLKSLFPPAPPRHSSIVLLEDHFTKIDQLRSTCPDIPFDQRNASEFARDPSATQWIIFHVADDKETTLELLAKLCSFAPKARIIGVVSRYQAFLVSYILEAGAYRCLVEDIHPGQLEKVLAS